MDGIKYTLTGEIRRGQVQNYHCKPHPLGHHVGAKHSDIAGLKKVDMRNLLKLGNDYASNFTIGFEVEKNSLHRNAVKEYTLFCGFERDSSCGYEAVTHILPLLPASTWRNKVFDMMHQAEKIIDDRYSPSDARCGGHITIAVMGLSGDELREKIRLNCGVIYALFRKRLKNQYCRTNLRMQSINDSQHVNGWSQKYQLALVKNGCLEFRVPSRVENVKQMMRRYELFYCILDHSINNPNGSHDVLLKRIKPVLMSMYGGNAEKVENIITLSKSFRKFIKDGSIAENISEFI